MINIAILVCGKLTDDCASTGCFNAYYDKKAAFKNYDEAVRLGTVFHCCGCEKNFRTSMAYKINQLKKANISIIHLARCMEVECNRIESIQKDLLEEGFQVVMGSHES